MKDDPLGQGYADQVREQMAKHTLWLNADNFDEMVEASYGGWQAQHPAPDGTPEYWRADADRFEQRMWRMMCAAALAVVEWRLGGRVRP